MKKLNLQSPIQDLLDNFKEIELDSGQACIDSNGEVGCDTANEYANIRKFIIERM